MEAGGDAPCRWRTRGIPGGQGQGPVGLTCIGVSQEGVLVLAAPQRGRGGRLILWQPREAGDAHVVHGRVGAQGALLTGLVLRRHPHPRPPAAQRLPEVVRRGPGGWVGGRGLRSRAAGRGRLTHTLALVGVRLAPARLGAVRRWRWGYVRRGRRAIPGREVGDRGEQHVTSATLVIQDLMQSGGQIPSSSGS